MDHGGGEVVRRDGARARSAALAAALFVAAPPDAAGQTPASAQRPAELRVARVTGGIEVDGSLGEPAWRQATRVDVWFETNPGDNIPPSVDNVGYLAYDGDYLYAGFEFSDPRPGDIRGPVHDRDDIGSEADYGGIIVDPGNTGRTGIELLVNARGVQFDAVYDDGGTEDVAPDFFWDSATRIHERGWTLEMRIPFSSLRYSRAPVQRWRILLYRNRPRDFRYQYWSARLPRANNCLICSANPLTGLENLPTGGGIVFAPYASGRYEGEPEEMLGSPLDHSFEPAIGFDAKWRPNASTAIDATVNPDFSQVESDVALISANERFALLFPEKRPFFLEGVELFATPIQAVYTRTMTDPQWGARGTGRLGDLSYTGLVVQDEGGGSVVIPRRNSSDLVNQDFRSWAAIGRLRYDLGGSFLGLLGTSREIEDGGHNRVAGPDFDWRPNDSDAITGQFLVSWTRTPELPDLSPDWDGSAERGYAGRLQWQHGGEFFDWLAFYQQFADEFRADDGFVPQVGYRRGSGELGYTVRPEEGLFRRLRFFGLVDRSDDLDEDLLLQQVSTGIESDARWSSRIRLAYAYDRVLAREDILPRHQLLYDISMSPTMKVALIQLKGSAGEQIDFDNARVGTGVDLSLGLTLQPTPHLELVVNESLRWLDVRQGGDRRRLFTARVDRLRATYNFTPRLFLRAIGQYEVTRRKPDLYIDPIDRKDAIFSGSALFAFKLDWQSVLFVGYGDTRVFSSDTLELEPATRQLFIKFSYAFQR